MKLENQNILITSNEPWGGVWYSKHNYAYELSKKNKVFFINSPTKWTPKNLFYNKVTSYKFNENLTILTYQNFFPLLIKQIHYLNNFLVSWRLKKKIKKLKISDYILWSFNPTVLYLPKLLGAKFSIFHCADKHWTDFYGTHHLCRNADVMFLISKHIADEYVLYNIPKFYLHHGISQDEFQIDKNAFNENQLELSNYGLYIGVIDERIDYELLEKAIQQHLKTLFVFIGPLQFSPSNLIANKIFSKKNYPNVIYLGSKDFKSLKQYISRAKFCISFMNKNHPGNTISHHKTLLYLAQGKPVFSYRFLEYRGKEDIMYMSENHNETLRQLKHFLEFGEDFSLREKRIAFAKEFTYENNFIKAEGIINEILSKTELRCT